MDISIYRGPLSPDQLQAKLARDRAQAAAARRQVNCRGQAKKGITKGGRQKKVRLYV